MEIVQSFRDFTFQIISDCVNESEKIQTLRDIEDILQKIKEEIYQKWDQRINEDIIDLKRKIEK